TTKKSTKMTTTTTEKTEEPSATDRIQRHVDDSVKTADKALTESAAIRLKKNYGVLVTYSPIDLLIPSKIGGSFYFTSLDKANQYEFQFLTSTLSASGYSVDIASMTEQKFSFMNRNFSQDSNFNFYYGLSYATLEAKLGADYLNSVPANQRPNTDMLKIHVLALDLGIGNRWYFDNGLNIGVDWIGITQPITSLKKEQHFTDYSINPDEKDNVDKFLNLATFLPRLYLLKFQLGYSF
ncbi:MAG: hypothetical protein H7235_04380, partial [Bdellovibrionaceae bacterium]|nr:hypothetical protein [Pseudobdellovibrionaceae bacterium]